MNRESSYSLVKVSRSSLQLGKVLASLVKVLASLVKVLASLVDGSEIQRHTQEHGKNKQNRAERGRPKAVRSTQGERHRENLFFKVHTYPGSWSLIDSLIILIRNFHCDEKFFDLWRELSSSALFKRDIQSRFRGSVSRGMCH